MRALLKKPIEGLEVGQIYELIEQRGGYLTWRNITTNEEIEYIYNGGYKTFFNYFYVFQELPATITQQVRELIEQYEVDRPEQHDNAVHRYAVDKGLPFSNSNEMFAAYKQLASEDAGNFVSAVKELLEGDTKDE